LVDVRVTVHTRGQNDLPICFYMKTLRMEARVRRRSVVMMCARG
jgi:hypothetical protein